MVGAGRFELPTPCSRSKCATRLRYAPPDRQLRGTAPEHHLQRIVLGEGGFIALEGWARKQGPGRVAAGSVVKLSDRRTGYPTHTLALGLLT